MTDRSGVSRPSGLLPALDALLFDGVSWRCLDAGNRQVPGVYPGDLSAALELVGRGPVATVYGRLRGFARVVDIDLAGDDGRSAVDQLEAFAERHGLWFLTRPSGGGDGRHHVYLLVRDAAGDQLTVVQDELARLREWFEAPRSAIDLREVVRPLSAPHRSGQHVDPYGDVAAALADLTRRLADPRASGSAGAVGGGLDAPQDAGRDAAGAGTSRDRRVPLIPRPRPRRDLDPVWVAYLATGHAPVLGGQDHSRSAVEVVCLKAMIRAGYTWRQALHAIWDAHDDAMTRARSGGLHRLVGIWNTAVVDDAAWTARHGITSGDPTPRPVQGQATDEVVAAAVGAARARLHDLAWTLTPRQRPAVLLVADALLERIIRTRALRVPCPERDLAEDTGLDRATIRAALHQLHATVGFLHTDTHSHSPAHRATTSHEFEIDPAQVGVWQIPPPSSHTPLPGPPPPGTWATLPPRAHQLYRALPAPGAPGLPLADLATAALATQTPTSPLTPSQARTLTDTLRALARAGLARCDEHGRWSRHDRPTAEHAARAAAAYSDLLDRHAAERAAYRSCTGTDWDTARRDALARNHARQQAWWRALPPAERAARRDAGRARYRALPLTAQAHLKDTLAERRRRAGIDEAERHAAWLAAWHPDALAQRQAEHTHAYHALPHPLQTAYAAMWHDHRTRWAIPHPVRRSSNRARVGAP